VAPAVVVTRGDPSQAVVALTFDAGSDCGNVDAILGALAENGIPATFGLTGRWVEQCPAEAGRIGAAGHDVMNHSYSHPSFTGYSTGAAHLTESEMADQITRGEQAIIAATGRSPRPLFRAPYGDQDARVHQALGAAGYRYDVLWTVDSLGWDGATPAQIVQTVSARLGNGAIVLMHVGAASADDEALQGVIDAARSAGLGFATITDVL
jgi:peptidoglycan/xylan/chitin deacetylase (PgdA/CDA1 family)